MAIQNRRGGASDFVPSKLLPGEFAVVQSGDSSTTDGKAVYLAFASGSVKRLMTDADMDSLTYDLENDIESVSGDLAELATTVGNVSSTAEAALTQANANYASISELAPVVASASSTADSALYLANANQSRIAGLDSRIGLSIMSVRSTAEYAAGKADSNESAIAEINTDLAAIHQELDGVLEAESTEF